MSNVYFDIRTFVNVNKIQQNEKKLDLCLQVTNF